MTSKEVNHNWNQSDHDVEIVFPLGDAERFPEDVQARNIKCTFGTSSLSVSVNGESLFQDELVAKVVQDESSWLIDGTGQKRQLVVTLVKKTAKKKWPYLCVTEMEEVRKTAGEDFVMMNLDDMPERVETQLADEKRLEAKFLEMREAKGLDSEETLAAFFEMFDTCIQLYRLNKLSDYLVDVVEVCRRKGGTYKLKAIQAYSFVSWKRSNFKLALELFLEMEDILGKSAALCENIAHTYNSMGDYDKAEQYFRESLKFIESESGSNQGNRGGVLLGLGLVRDRLGKLDEALKVVEQAYNFYKDRAMGEPASLQAKAGISCAKINAKLERFEVAEKYVLEAINMYEITCGKMSPLTASAYQELGIIYWQQRKRELAQKALKRAYEIEIRKDAFCLLTILEIHNLLMDTLLKELDCINRVAIATYFPLVEYCLTRVRKLPQDGNAAVYYKAAGEMKVWGGAYSEGRVLLVEAMGLFEGETTVDTTNLISICESMKAFCDRNLAGTQDSPMVLDLTETQSSKIVEIEDDDDDASVHSVHTVHSTHSVKSDNAAHEASPVPDTTSSTTQYVEHPEVIRLCKTHNLDPEMVYTWLLDVVKQRQEAGCPVADFGAELRCRLAEIEGPAMVRLAIDKRQI